MCSVPPVQGRPLAVLPALLAIGIIRIPVLSAIRPAMGVQPRLFCVRPALMDISMLVMEMGPATRLVCRISLEIGIAPPAKLVPTAVRPAK